MNLKSCLPSRESLQHDVLSSIVVFLVALPLCMGIAIASGAPVSAGLITGIVAGLVVGTLAGCPLQVSGPAAGLTVLVYDIIQRHGLEMLGLIVLMAGAMQIAAGAFRLGQWFRAVSPAVIQGMLAGIGVLIFASQFHVMLDDRPQGSGLTNLATIPAAASKAFGQIEAPPEDVRNKQRLLLQSLGELHREQAELSERILEHVPDHDVTQAPLADVRAYAEPQAQLAAQLKGSLEQSQLYYADTPRRMERIEKRHAAAVTALQKATQALEENRVADVPALQRKADASLEEYRNAHKHHTMAASVGVLTILLLVFWKPLAPHRLKVIPAPLVAVLAATALAAIWSLPILYVEVPQSIVDEIRLPTLAILQDAPWGGLAASAVLIAVVASAETLLSATAVDQLHEGVRTRYDKELVAQGVGNMICGTLGALPMTGVIVRSSANVQSGARTRLSAILHGLWLLVFVAAFASLLRMVPTACLAGVLVYTGYKLVNPRSIAKLRQYGWGEVAIYAATVTTIVAVDLLSGVLVGIGLATLKLVYTFSHLRSDLHYDIERRRAVLRLQGAATFVRLPQLAAELERVPAGSEFHVDLEHLDYIDHACLELLMTWTRQHESTGGTTTIDWNRLHMTVRKGPRVTDPASPQAA